MSYNTSLAATSTRSANDAVEQASLAAQALALLSAAVQTINDMNTQIAAAVEEQARVAEELSRLIQGVGEETAQDANQPPVPAVSSPSWPPASSNWCKALDSSQRAGVRIIVDNQS